MKVYAQDGSDSVEARPPVSLLAKTLGGRLEQVLELRAPRELLGYDDSGEPVYGERRPENGVITDEQAMMLLDMSIDGWTK